MSIIGLINHGDSIILVADSIVTDTYTGDFRNNQKIYKLGSDDSYITTIGSASLFSFLDYQHFLTCNHKRDFNLNNFKDGKTIKQIFSQIHKFQCHLAFIFVANRSECVIWTIKANKIEPKDENDYKYDRKYLKPNEYFIYHFGIIVPQKYLNTKTENSIISDIKNYNSIYRQSTDYKVDDTFSYVILPSNPTDKIIYKCTDNKIKKRNIGGLKSKIEIIKDFINKKLK